MRIPSIARLSIIARPRSWPRDAPLLTACALTLCAIVSVQATGFDPEHTHIGFSLKTRWGQVLRGRFPQYTGEIESLPDGRYRARFRLDTRSVEIVNQPKYTKFTRGEGFFEAARFPEVEFVSDPYAPGLLRSGGKLAGELKIRDVRRRETFVVEPSACARPALDCDTVAAGTVRRSDYGVDRWLFAVSDQVRFQLRLRRFAEPHEAVP